MLEQQDHRSQPSRCSSKGDHSSSTLSPRDPDQGRAGAHLSPPVLHKHSHRSINFRRVGYGG